MNAQFLEVVLENFSWIFDGVGTEIICSVVSLIIGGLGGGLIGYKIGIKNRIKQSQKAGDHTTQQQIGSINIHYDKK